MQSADRVETSVCNGLKVGKRHPAFPVLFEDITSVWDLLTESILVNYALLSLKDGRCDPSSLAFSLQLLQFDV